MLPMHRLSWPTFGLALFFALAPLQTNGQPLPAATEAEIASATDPAPAQTAASATTDPILATYRGGEVKRSELRAMLAAMPAAMRAQYQGPKGQAALLEEAIRFELLAMEARRRGYDKREAVQQQLKKQAVRTLIRQRVHNRITRHGITASEVASYYKEQISEFNRPELRRASHIVVASEQEASALIGKLTGKDLRTFRGVAQRTSLDETTKLRGGDLRYFDALGDGDNGLAGPETALAKAAFGIKARGLLHPKPIRTSAGYSVLMLTGKKAAIVRSVETVEDLIRNRLLQQKRQEALNALVTKLKKELSPQVHAELIALVKFEPEPGTLPTNNRLPEGFPVQGKPADNRESGATK